MYSIRTKVGSSSTDRNGKMKFVSALDFMQDCSQLWLESEPEVEKHFKDNHIAQILISRQLDVLRYPLYGEKLTATTSIYDCKAFYGFRNTVICGQDGKACFLSWSIGAFVNLDTGKLARIGKDLIEKAKMDEKIDMEYLDNKIIVPKLSDLKEEPVKVRRQDIDFNKHLNNARYADYAVEFLPEDFEIKRMRVEYKAPSIYGDILFPKTVNAGEKFFVSLQNEEEKTKAVLEFTKYQPL